MKKGKTKKDLLQNIYDNIQFVRDNPKIDEEIKEQLAQHGVLHGEVQQYINKPNLLKEADIRFLGLLAEQIYLKNGNQNLNIENWFNESEIVEMRQYYLLREESEVSLPRTIEHVIEIASNVWLCSMDVPTIAKLMKANVLYYNYDIQRQVDRKKRKNQVIEKPTVNKKNVKEMTELLLNKELLPTTLAFNGAVRTAKDGEEFTYNHKELTLTINEGTRLDILDGYHRCLASLEAYEKNPDINFRFSVQFSNFTTKVAQNYQAQLAKATPIHKSRIKELEAKRYSDLIVQQLKTESDLKNRISSSKKLSITAGEIVSYELLANAIDIEFPMKNKIEALDIGDYLIEFFDYLMGYFGDRFERREKDDLLPRNKMFVGYIVLAKRFKDEEIPVKKLKNTLENIDFSRNNPIWTEMNIIKEGTFTTSAEKSIRQFFEKVEIK